MKKITSILCALSLILSVTASPLHSPKPMKTNKQQIEQKLANANSDNPKAEIIYKYKKAQKSKNTSAIVQNKKAKVQKAKKESVNLSIERYSTFYDAANGTIFYGLHLPDGIGSYFFEINLPQGKHDVEYGKTYTLEDMNSDYCEWDDEEGTEHYYTTATFKKTKGANYDIHIEAKVVDTDGNEFELYYHETPVIPTGETVNINITRPLTTCEYLTDNSWLIRGNNNTYYVDLRYFSDNSTSPVGTFISDDIDLTSTYVHIVTDELDEYDEPIEIDVYAKDANITVTQSQEDSRLDVSFSFLGENGIRYTGNMFYATPKAEAQDNFISTNLSIDDFALTLWNEINAFATSDDGKYISLNLYPQDSEQGILGDYEISENSNNNASITVAEEMYNIYSGTITISLDNDGDYVMTGKLLAWNNTEYTLNLTTPDPVITKATFNGQNLVIDTYLSDGFFELSGHADDNPNNFILITINSSSVAGTYTSQFDETYTYVIYNSNTYIYSSANITVTYENGIATATGTITFVNDEDKYDILELTINLKAGPYIPSVRNITIGDIAFNPSGNGPLLYGLVSDDYMQVFYFTFSEIYWVPDVDFDKTYTEDYLDLNNSLGENSYDHEYIFYQTVSFTKTKVEDNNIKIVVTILDSRGNTWNLTYIGQDKELEDIYVELGQANQIGWGGNDGLQYQLIDNDNSLACYLVFPLELEHNQEWPEDVVYEYLYTSQSGEINLEASYLSIRKEEHKLTFAQFSKVVEGDAVSVNASVIDDRGFTYHLSYYDDGFHLTGETIQVVINTPVEAYSWDYGEWIINAEDNTQAFHFDIYSNNDSSPVGYFTNEVSTWNSNVDFLIDAEENNWQQVNVHSVEYVVVSESDGNYLVEATIIGEDGIVYEIIAGTNVSTSLQNINSSDSSIIKRFENGMIIIEKDGVRYNALGERIK